jgi:radical SAM superfamily enzyme YgiQ (UPF0313 family)
MADQIVRLRGAGRDVNKPEAVRESAVFVLVYNDVFGNVGVHGTTTQGKLGSPHLEGKKHVVDTSIPTLMQALGLSEDEFFSFRFGDRGSDPIFEPHATKLWSFLTSHQVATILDTAGISTVAIGEQTLVDRRATLGDVDPADVVAIGISTTFTFDAATLNLLIERARELAPNAPVVVGGAGITLNNDWFDRINAEFMVNGDAEAALPQLVARLASGGMTFDDIPNLHWKDKDGAVQKTARDYDAVPMDSVPTPRWNLLNAGGTWPRAIWYESLRGCPFRCKFCSYPQQSPNWRTKSAARMVDEFFFYAANGVEVINCFDSTMLTPPKRMREFCQMLIAKGPPVRWACWGHPSQLQDPSLLVLMSQAGCRLVSVGVESGDEQVLLNMNKHITTPKALQALENVKAAGMLCIAHFFVGFPGETEESAGRTLDFLRQARPDFYTLQPFQVRDRTIPILQEADDYGFHVQWGEFGRVEGWTHATMTSEQAQALVHRHTSHAIENFDDSVHWDLMRLQGGVIVLGLRLRDADETREFRRVVKPMLKSFERAVIHHPDARWGASDRKDRALVAQYMEDVRSRMKEAVASGILRVDPFAGKKPAAQVDLSGFAPATGLYTPPSIHE